MYNVIKQSNDGKSYWYLETAPGATHTAGWTRDKSKAAEFLFQDQAQEALDDLDKVERNRAWMANA